MASVRLRDENSGQVRTPQLTQLRGLTDRLSRRGRFTLEKSLGLHELASGEYETSLASHRRMHHIETLGKSRALIYFAPDVERQVQNKGVVS